MTDWREHNGGPQPVGDDVWICIDAMPEEMEEAALENLRRVYEAPKVREVA